MRDKHSRGSKKFMNRIIKKRSSRETLKYIRSLPVLSEFDDKTLAELAAKVIHIDLRAGEHLFREGDIADAMYILISGRLDAIAAQSTTKKAVVGEILPGTPVGEIALLIGGKRNADVIAVEDCELIMLTKDNFTDVVKKYRQIRKLLLDVVLRRLRKKQLLNILTGYFGEIDEETHSFLRSKFEWVHVTRGRALFKSGGDGDNIFILVNGLLEAVAVEENGPQKTIGRITQGEIVGEMAIITGEKRTADVYAVRECDLVRLSKESFEEICSRYPQVMMKITRILIKRLQNNYCTPQKGYTSVTMTVVPMHGPEPAADFTSRLERAFSKLGAAKIINSDVLYEQFGVKDIAQVRDNDPRSIGLIAWLEEQERTYPFVIYQADTVMSNWSRRCRDHADHILYVTDFNYARSSSAALKDGTGDKFHGRSNSAKKTVIFIHDGDYPLPYGVQEVLKGTATAYHHIRREMAADYERLARILSNRAIGLVLGGGGAKGIAHIGIIRALEEAGIPIDMIGGSSIGSIIGGMYAMGRSYDEMVALCKKIFIEIDPMREYTLPLISLLRGKRALQMARTAFGDTCIEDLWIKYFCISCNLSRSAIKIHREGLLRDAARASSSLPGIAVPVLFNKEVHVDGGVINNLPGDVMREQCGTVIVAQLKNILDTKTEIDEFPSPWKLLLNRLVPFKKRIDVPNILDIMMSTIIAGSTIHTKQVLESADLCLIPPVDHVKLLDFKDIDKIAEIGYRYTRDAIQNIDDRDLMEKIRGRSADDI